jgi:DNA transposition AAA+ family ATPase
MNDLGKERGHSCPPLPTATTNQPTPPMDATSIAEHPVTETNRISPSLAAEASSAHSRINIPLNLDNWRSLPADVQPHLLWFHQHALDARLEWKDCEEALGYDKSTVFRILKGDYAGSWQNIVGAIKSYRKLCDNRGRIQVAEFVQNSITRRMWDALDYALAASTIVIITGESRMGKTCTGTAWRDANNHGRSVFVTAPAYGGTKSLLRDIAATLGVNRNLSIPAMQEAVYRGFNKNRMLMVDEAHRLLPADRRTNPVSLELLRDIHDRTGCALALLATARFDTELRNKEYMFEQLLGRALPVRLVKKIKAADIEPIIKQYVRRISDTAMTACVQLANERGRLGALVEVLRVASRMASKAGSQVTEEILLKSIAIRTAWAGVE